jgi:hypothetical protein
MRRRSPAPTLRPKPKHWHETFEHVLPILAKPTEIGSRSNHGCHLATNEHPRVCANDQARRSGAMLILLATSLGMPVAQIDSSMVNLAIKQIGSDLDASVNALQ